MLFKPTARKELSTRFTVRMHTLYNLFICMFFFLCVWRGVVDSIFGSETVLGHFLSFTFSVAICGFNKHSYHQ